VAPQAPALSCQPRPAAAGTTPPGAHLAAACGEVGLELLLLPLLHLALEHLRVGRGTEAEQAQAARQPAVTDGLEEQRPAHRPRQQPAHLALHQRAALKAGRVETCGGHVGPPPLAAQLRRLQAAYYDLR
jgi:hypothetical protein